MVINFVGEDIMYGKTELQARYELIHTDDISRKISTNPEYMMQFGYNSRQKGTVTLIHSIRDTDTVIDDIIMLKENEAMKVFMPSKFGKGKDPLLQLNTLRHMLDYSDHAIILYADNPDTRVAYGMAAGHAKPILLLDPSSDVKGQIREFDASASGYKMKDNILMPIKSWEQFENDWGRFLSVWKPKISIEYDKPVPYDPDSFRPVYTHNIPQLTKDTAVRVGILLATRKPFRIENQRLVRDVAQLEKESGIEGYSTALSRLHEHYNKS